MPETSEPERPRPDRIRAIEAVSALLTSKDAGTIGRPTLEPIPSPDLSGPLAGLADRPALESGGRAVVHATSPTLNTPAVAIPDGPAAGEVDRVERAGDGPIAIEPPSTSRPAGGPETPGPRPVRPRPIPAGGGATRTVEPARGELQPTGPATTNLGPTGRPPVPTPDATVPIDGSWIDPTPTVGPREGDATPPAPGADPIGPDEPKSPGAAIPPRVFANVAEVALPRDPGPSPRGSRSGRPSGIDEIGATDPAAMASGDPVGSGQSFGSPTVAVRNPLSGGSGPFGLMDLPPTGPVEKPEGPGENPVGFGFGLGGPNPAEGGGSADLSQTNDLLRQLIDVIRNQKSSTLPAGGPRVYAER